MFNLIIKNTSNNFFIVGEDSIALAIDCIASPIIASELSTINHSRFTIRCKQTEVRVNNNTCSRGWEVYIST